MQHTIVLFHSPVSPGYNGRPESMTRFYYKRAGQPLTRGEQRRALRVRFHPLWTFHLQDCPSKHPGHSRTLGSSSQIRFRTDPGMPILRWLVQKPGEPEAFKDPFEDEIRILNLQFSCSARLRAGGSWNRSLTATQGKSPGHVDRAPAMSQSGERGSLNSVRRPGEIDRPCFGSRWLRPGGGGPGKSSASNSSIADKLSGGPLQIGRKGLFGWRWIVDMNAPPSVCHKPAILARTPEICRTRLGYSLSSRAAPAFAQPHVHEHAEDTADPQLSTAERRVAPQCRRGRSVGLLKPHEGASRAAASRTSVTCCNNLKASDRNFHHDQHDYNPLKTQRAACVDDVRQCVSRSGDDR